MRRLHPATIIVALLPRLREAVQAAFPVLIGSFATGHGGNQEWVGIVIGSLTGIFAIGGYWTTRFGIEPDHVVHRTGWIFRKDRRIPLAQIQNVNLRQNVLERIFKVATIDVETAMGKGRDLKLSVLGLADAEKFREELLGAAHLDTIGGPKDVEPLVTLNRHDLLWGALTENHLAQSIIAMFTVGGPAIGAIVNFTSKMAPLTAAAVFGGAFIGLAAAAWLYGAVVYYLKYGGFVVRRSENVFRITYGLLNKVQMAIRPSRIEYVQLSTTIPQRQLGRTSLQVGTASTFGEAGVLAPVALFVHRYVAYASASDVIPGLQIGQLEWKPFHAVFYRASVIRKLIWLGIFGVIAAWISLGEGGSVAIIAWTVMTFFGLILMGQIVALFLSRPENGYAITDDAFVVRQGYFHQTVRAMPIERMENVAINQPMWWKRHRAVALTAQAMKHRIGVGAIPASSADELMMRWQEKIEAQENRRLLELTMGLTESLETQEADNLAADLVAEDPQASPA